LWVETVENVYILPPECDGFVSPFGQ
jgi:hypothetical protein